MTTVPNVAPNELIESAWGNAVAAVCNSEVVRRDGSIMTGMLTLANQPPTANNHAARKSYVDNVVDDRVAKSGDRMNGMLLLPAETPSDASHATRKGYVDNMVGTRVSRSGDTMSGNLNMGGNSIVGLADPNDTGHAANKRYVDQQAGAQLARSGGTMTGNINMNGNTVAGLAEPAAAAHAATKGYVDNGLSRQLALTGGNMTGHINMGGNSVTGLGDPTAGGMAVSFGFAEGRYQRIESSDPRLKERAGPIVGASERVQRLARSAFRGRWRSDDDRRDWDFIASTDVAEVAPYAVHGEPGAVGARGEIIPQTVRFDRLVPLVVAALGEALDRIDQLETTLRGAS